jgi:hypothetical protein
MKKYSDFRFVRFAQVVAVLISGLFINPADAQDYLHQVVVFSEGWSNWETGEVMEPATMGTYDPSLQTFVVQDTLENAGFVSDAVIHESSIYVAADGEVLRYDLNTFELIASVAVVGVRQLAIFEDLIYLTRGDVDAMGMTLPLDSYLMWLDLETLTIEGDLSVADGPMYATEGLVVLNEKLYIGVNNAFDWGNEVGFIGEYDPFTAEYVEWSLGEEGKNPIHLFAQNDQVVSINNRDYASTSLSWIMAGDESPTTHLVAETNAGCLAAAMTSDGNLRYQVSQEGAIREANQADLTVSTLWLENTPEYYGMAFDPVSGDLYASVTDYSTFGFVEIRNEGGTLMGQFDCGVSPGVICMDVRSLVSTHGIRSPLQGTPSQWTFDAIGREIVGMSSGYRFEIDEFGQKRVVILNGPR